MGETGVNKNETLSVTQIGSIKRATDEGKMVLVIVVYEEKQARASLVAQWLRVCLPMRGTRV